MRTCCQLPGEATHVQWPDPLTHSMLLASLLFLTIHQPLCVHACNYLPLLYSCCAHMPPQSLHTAHSSYKFYFAACKERLTRTSAADAEISGKPNFCLIQVSGVIGPCALALYALNYSRIPFMTALTALFGYNLSEQLPVSGCLHAMLY